MGWVKLFGLVVPVTKTAYLTQDLDLYCATQDAEWLADQLQTKLHVPELGHASCQTGKLTYSPGDGRGLLVVDFLNGVLGLETEHVRRLAVPVNFNGREINLLHPLLCLHSRLANLYLLEEKRDGNGLAQAEVAVAVAEKYLESLHPGDAETLRAVRRIIRVSSRKESAFCFAEWGIDPLLAISHRVFKGRERVLQKYRFRGPLASVYRRREAAEARKNGVQFHSRAQRGAEEKVRTALEETISQWSGRA